MTVPSVVVHRLEGHAPRLHGSHSRSAYYSVGDQVGQPQIISSSVDGYTASVVGLSTRGFRPMCSCSVTSTCRWCTIIGSTSEVSRISHSGEITYLSCACCCRYRWSSRRTEWSRQTPPARVRYVRLRKSPKVVDRSPRTNRRAYRRRRPVRVMEPPVENIPVPQRGRWFLIVDLCCCLYRCTLVGLTCRRVGFRRCRPVWTCFPTNVRRRSVGGGGLVWINLSEAWCCSTSGPWN